MSYSFLQHQAPRVRHFLINAHHSSSMAPHPCSLIRYLANLQRLRFVIYPQSAVSFREVSTCVWGGTAKSVTAAGGRGICFAPARVVTQSLFYRLWGSGTSGRMSTPRMLSSSAVWSSSKRQDGGVTSNKKSDDEHGSVLMQVFSQKKEPKQLTVTGKGALQAHTPGGNQRVWEKPLEGQKKSDNSNVSVWQLDPFQLGSMQVSR